MDHPFRNLTNRPMYIERTRGEWLGGLNSLRQVTEVELG